MPGTWTNAPGGASPSQATVPMGRADWWSQLDDPAIDHLVSAGLGDNATLVAVGDAGKLPAIGIEGSATRTSDRFDPTGGPSYQISAALGARLFLEFDLWSRGARRHEGRA